MSQYPYLVERSAFPVNHLPSDRYNYPDHDRAQRDLTSSHWLQPISNNRPSDYILDSGPLVAQFSAHYGYSSSSRSSNHAHVPDLTAVHPEHSGWDVEPVPEQSSRLVPVNPTNIGYPTQLNYPIVNQQPTLSASPQLQPQAEIPPPTHHPSLSRSPSRSSRRTSTSQWDDDLYRIPESHSFGRSALTPSTPLVKMEQDDSIDPFVMEPFPAHFSLSNLSQSLAPPMEVPLRATHAPPEMRRMMGSFRLNPFSIHSGEGKGVAQATWSGGKPRALDDEPLFFEFQLKLDGAEEPAAAAEPLRTFSPEFELHEDHSYEKASEWEDEYQTESVYTTSTPPTWEMEYPASSEEPYSSSESITHSRPPSTSRLHHVASHPYLRKPSSRETSESYDAHRPSTFTSRDYANRMRAPDAAHPQWSQGRVGPPPPRSSTYASDESPGFNPSLLPSVTSANRRWSLPDNAHPYPHAPFLVQG